MEFGVILPTEYPPGADAEASRQTIDTYAEWIEAYGYDSLWVGEHHFTDDLYFNNFELLAYLAAKTSDVTLGTSVCLVPLYNPVHLAELVANVDVLSGGRFIFGAGVGYREREFETFGVDRSTRGTRMTEALEILGSLWSSDDVTYDGKAFEFDGVSINPKPLQAGGPDVWIGGNSPPAVRRAAEMGEAWLIDPRISVDELSDPFEHYERTLNGTEPSARPIWRETFVAESRAEALERVRPHLLEKYERYLDWGGGEDAEYDLGTQFETLADERFLIGTPDDVVSKIREYRARYDVDYLVLRSYWPGMDPDTSRKSLELFSEEVAPEFG